MSIEFNVTDEPSSGTKDRATVQIPVTQLAAIYEALKLACHLGRTKLSEIEEISEDVFQLRSKIHGYAEMPSILAGQYLPEDVRKACIENVKKQIEWEEVNPNPDPNEPIRGKTYIKDGWRHQDIPLLVGEQFERLQTAIGTDHLVMLAGSSREIGGKTFLSGQSGESDDPFKVGA